MALNFSTFPKQNYVHFPTPLHPLPRFSEALGGPTIYIKRDDMLPGAGGGNKTRKLDFLIADALIQGADTLVTGGAIQSNHCRLTLSAAAREGLKCHLVLYEPKSLSFDPNSSGNNFLFKLLGAKSITIVPKGSNMWEEMQKVAAEVQKHSGKPYVIPIGGSNEIGATGYACCAQEVLEQLQESNLKIDEIILPSGSGGTHAGFVTGLWANTSPIPVVGICVTRPKQAQETLVCSLVKKVQVHLGMSEEIPLEMVSCVDSQVGPGYALPTQAMVEAVKLLAQTEGILLDPVYSGKTMAGLMEFVKNGRYKKDENVLFLHTGGSPALFAYLDVFNPVLNVPVRNFTISEH